MRAIDADALTEILTTAIRNMEGMAKFIGCEDDPEIKMEIQAYRDILNGVKEQPTIEPEIIRCKDCKYFMYDDQHKGVNCCIHDDGLITSSYDGFCSYAKRRK